MVAGFGTIPASNRQYGRCDIDRLLHIFATLIAAVALAGPAGAQGMSSENYRIPSAVLNSGGGITASAQYTLFLSIGEPVVGPATSAAGDVNRDGRVNHGDVGTVLRIAAGAKSARDADVDFPQADADNNARIELLDAETLLRRLDNLSGHTIEFGIVFGSIQ